ncbi:MAG: hypothetical protein ABIZ49_05230 [Opitutaceae bacterium]
MPTRAIRLVRLALLGLLTSGSWLLASSIAPAASVVAIQPTRIADLVLLDRGFDAGLREGMVCRVARGTSAVADVLLVEVRPTCSAALIVSSVPKQSIRAGDTASIKILKT